MTETVDYPALVARLTQQLDAMRAEVPFLAEQRQTNLRRLISAAGVSDAFVQYLASVIQQTARLQAATHDDTADVMLNQRRCAKAFTQLETDLRALADSIHGTMMILRAESASLALNAYAVLQSLLRQPGGQALGPQVRQLRALLGRGRPRKGAKKALDAEGEPGE